jgi:hypothetical protein
MKRQLFFIEVPGINGEHGAVSMANKVAHGGKLILKTLQIL